MTKLRDGYFRQVDSKVGDDNYLLKARGGYIGLHTGRNNEANKVVRTDENGYIQAGWINTTSGSMDGSTPTRIYASYDGYIRYMTPVYFFSNLSNSGNNISITVGGQNRTLTVGYASNADTLDNLDSSYFLTCGMRNLIARNVYNSSVQGFRWTPGRIITEGTRRLSFSGGNYYTDPYRSEGPYGYYSVSFWYKVENYVKGTTIGLDINDVGVGNIDVSSNKGWTFFSGGCKERTDSARYGFLDFETDFSQVDLTLTVSDIVVVRGTNRSQTWFPAPEDLVDTYSNQTIGGTKTFSNEISGTITTATKLKTSRKLWYQSFDGTADINGTISFTQGEEYGLLWKYDNTYTDARIYHATGVYQDHTKGDLNYDAGSWTSSDDIISHLFKVKSSINALAIMNSGKVGIGTITPQYSIDIVGHASIRSSSAAAYPTLWFHEYYDSSTNWSARIVQDGYGASGLGTVTGYTHGMFFVGGRGGEYDNFIFSKHNGTPLFKIGYNSLNVNGIPMYTNANIYYTAENGGIYKMPRKKSSGGGWAWEFITLVDNADNAFFRIGGYGGRNDLNWIYLGVNTYADENMLRIKPTSLSWGSYNILHAGNSYVNSSGKGYINNSEITYIDNSNKLDGLDSTDFLRYIPHNTEWSTKADTPTNLAAGIHQIHVYNVEYSSILTGYDYNGAYWQFYFHPTSGYSENIQYRATNCTTWKTILDSNNSSVSKSGETLTVKINGSTESLTNTWRGIQNNLTSDSTTESLSAAQGKALAGRLSTIEGDYLTRTTAQTVTGAKTFNSTKWILYGTESDNILNKADYIQLWKFDDSARVSQWGYSITNSIAFNWYNDEWRIGQIRSGDSATQGFAIALLNSSDTHALDIFRLEKTGKGYLKGNEIITTANLPAYPTQQSLGGPFLPLAGGTMDKKSLIQAASSNNDHQAGAIRIREYNYAGSSDNNNFNTHPENAPKIQFYWSGNNSVSLGSSGYEFFRMYSSTAVYKIWDEGNDGSGSGLDADKLDGYHLTDIYWADQKVQSGSLSNTTPTFGGITTNTFYATNGDATIKLYYYDHNDTNGAESVFIQSCFDAKDPLTSNYVTSYASRCYISLQPRGGRVGINMGTSRASYPLQVNGSIGATSIINTTYNSSDKILMSDGSVLDKSTFAVSGHTHSYLIDATQNGTFTNNVIPTNLTAGMHRVHRPGTDYISILHGYDFSGGYWQLVFQTSTWISPSITYRASNQTDFVTLLTSGNSSVSKSGETLTVKINGTEQSLTNTNTWRGIQNNLTSDSTTDSLSAAQGKALNGRLSAIEGDYLTRTTAQTVSGAKTFNDSKWVLASSEASEITNKADYIALYNASNTGYLWPDYSKVPSSIRFRWYSDYWRIGHVRSGSTPTGGFVIALESGDHLVDRFRLSSDGTGYLNGNVIITSSNYSSYISTSSADDTVWQDNSNSTKYRIQVVPSLPTSTNSNTFYVIV